VELASKVMPIPQPLDIAQQPRRFNQLQNTNSEVAITGIENSGLVKEDR
jgi:hypothetical protein